MKAGTSPRQGKRTVRPWVGGCASSVLLALAVCPAFSCDQSNRSDLVCEQQPIATASMAPRFSVASDGNTVAVSTVSTCECLPNAFFVAPGDSLVATIGHSSQTLSGSGFYDGPTSCPAAFSAESGYSAALGQPPGTADLSVAFLRGSGQTSAMHSVVTLAAPFRIASVPATFARGELIMVALSPQTSPLPPGQGRMSIAFEGSCLGATYEFPLARDLPFTGSTVFDTSVISFADETNGPFECDVMVHVRAATIGVTDPAFAVGTIDAVQEQTAQSHIARPPSARADGGTADASMASFGEDAGPEAGAVQADGATDGVGDDHTLSVAGIDGSPEAADGGPVDGGGEP